MAVTVNRGYAMPAWYDVDTLEEDGNQVLKHLASHKVTITSPPSAYLSYFLQDIEGLQKSKKRLSDIISNEVSSYQHVCRSFTSTP